MKNRIKEDNQGFTLVEIVVTIMVLAIITVPLLSYFTDSVRRSAKTKQQQNAVVLAQNTLEELKVSGQDLSDPYKVLATSTSTPSPSISPNPAATSAPATAATLIPWKEVTDQPLPAPIDGFYPTYYLYRTVNENDRSYLVQIKVTPKHNLTNTDASGATHTETYEKVVMPEINSSTDVILQEDSTSFNEAVRQFHTKHTKAGGTLTRDVIATGVRRSMRLTFQEDAGNADNIEVVIYYNYHYVGSGIAGLSGSNAYYQVSVKRASIPAEDLRNVFIFFQPYDKGDHLQFGPEEADDPYTETSMDFAALKSKGLTEGQVSLFLVAQNSAPAGEGDGTVPERPAGYRFTIGSASTKEVYKIFANTSPANSEKTVFTNLSKAKSEVDASGSELESLIFEKTTASGGKEYSLLKKEETDRIAEVEVSVFRDIGDGEETLKNEKQKLTTVNGAVVLDK